MAVVVEPPRWLERWNRPRIGTAGGVASIGVLSGIFVLPPVGDAVAVALALGIGSAAVWAWRKRSALEQLPLTLGEVAVRQVVDGRPSLRFRVWLGHGRAMRRIEATGVLHLSQGRDLPVPIEVPVEHACGPVTLTATLPPLASGTLDVTASVTEGGRSWATERTYSLDGAPMGPLDSPIRRSDQGLDWDRAAWDRPLSAR